MHYDYLIRGARPFYADGLGELSDFAIAGGRIAAVGQDLKGTAEKEIQAEGRLLLPSFVDSHTHLDKTLMGEDQDAPGLMAAIRICCEFEKEVPEEQIYENVLQRSRRVAAWQVSHGTGFIKSHVIADDIWGLRSAAALKQLQRELQGRAQLALIVPWVKKYEAQLHEMARQGEIDFVGGYPTLSPDYQESVDETFAFALQYGLPIDLHVDESDAANIDCFLYVLNKTIETGMQGRVSCGHVTALCAVDEDTARKAVDLAAKANVHIIALPSCNMYLMGRNDRGLVRRGVTRVDEFLRAGVNASLASDNIRDPFRPFGNGDMLEEALFTAQVLQYGTRGQMEEILRMTTYRPAANMLLQGYGLKEGCSADLVLLDSKDVRDAVISNAARLLILKDGKEVL